MAQNYYDILGITRDATAEELSGTDRHEPTASLNLRSFFGSGLHALFATFMFLPSAGLQLEQGFRPVCIPAGDQEGIQESSVDPPPGQGVG